MKLRISNTKAKVGQYERVIKDLTNDIDNWKADDLPEVKARKAGWIK